MIDFHAHLPSFEKEGRRELLLRKAQGITTVFSSGTPGEWEAYQRLSTSFVSFGIHPWQADHYEPKEFLPYYKGACAVGEIGMDAIWCEVPLEVQQRVFCEQLEIARRLRKPIVLHTKGQEEKIAKLVLDFPGKILVHWYAGDLQTLKLLVKKDCYFTLGPDLAYAKELDTTNRYRRMLEEIPINRLFTETDGVASLDWLACEGGLPIPTGVEAIQTVLAAGEAAIAAAKGLAVWQVKKQMEENFREFFGG